MSCYWAMQEVGKKCPSPSFLLKTGKINQVVEAQSGQSEVDFEPLKSSEINLFICL